MNSFGPTPSATTGGHTDGDTAIGTTSNLNQTTNAPSVAASQSTGMVTEQDSYAIISSGLLLSDLVRTALLRLGYSAAEAVGAKGESRIPLL